MTNKRLTLLTPRYLRY